MDNENRVIKMALEMIDGNKTVRQVAKIVGYSKSTVHNDLTTKLENIDIELYQRVKDILEYNKKIRHIRGGQKTKEKYAMIKSSCQ